MLHLLSTSCVVSSTCSALVLVTGRPYSSVLAKYIRVNHAETVWDLNASVFFHCKLRVMEEAVIGRYLINGTFWYTTFDQWQACRRMPTHTYICTYTIHRRLKQRTVVSHALVRELGSIRFFNVTSANMVRFLPKFVHIIIQVYLGQW